MSRPEFSLLHATMRLPDGWLKAANAWREACNRPAEVEYLLVVDEDDWQKIPLIPELYAAWSPWWDWQRLINHKRRCPVDAYNLAASSSFGNFLIVVADDWFPCNHWDTELHKAVPDFSKEAAVRVDCGPFTEHILIHPMLTRAYYERPGRGGCGGELFYPEYVSYGADDDFTEVAKLDGVIVDATHLKFVHHHPWAGNGSNEFAADGAYTRNDHAALEAKDRVSAQRKLVGYSK